MDEKAAAIIFLGLVLNGCLQMPRSNSFNEYAIIDEREIGEAMAEAACLLSGRDWKYPTTCEARNDAP
jgi:hypothetical protein